MDNVKIEQLSVFIENKPGRLAEICRTIGDAGINMRGISVADMAEYGIFRIITDDPKGAKKALKDKGFTVGESYVICVDVPDRPGGLAEVLEAFSDNGISVEYLYLIANTKFVFSVENIDQVLAVLEKEKVRLLTQQDVARL